MTLAATAESRAADAPWTETYADLLKRYVTPEGNVRYQAWKANGADLRRLNQVVQGIAGADLGRMNRAEQLAFYLNAYNAWILHEALEKYPTKSVKDLLFTFFLSNRLTVAGEKMSFNRLEKDIIRRKFDEPLIHFALNCASQSCPPLLDEPYRAGNLKATMEKQTRAFVNSPRGVVVDGKTARLSKIFDWYKEDFPKGDVLGFVNKWRNKPIPAGAKIEYQDYDWGLNAAR